MMNKKLYFKQTNSKYQTTQDTNPDLNQEVPTGTDALRICVSSLRIIVWVHQTLLPTNDCLFLDASHGWSQYIIVE